MGASPYQQARSEALPYARAIVGARKHPARFNLADIDHAISLEIGAIASTAISQKRTVEEVVRRHHPEMFEAPTPQPIPADEREAV
jgi:hypothetical protein